MTTIFKVMKRKWQKKTIRILRGRDAQPWMLLLFLFFCCDQTLYIKTKCAHCLLPDESLKHMTESLTKKEKKSIEQKHKQSLSRFSHVSDNFENLIARIVAIILIDDDHETITTRKLRKLKTKIENRKENKYTSHFFCSFFSSSICFSTMEKISSPIWISRIAYKSLLNHNRQHHSQDMQS